MPKAMHDALERQADKKGLKGKERNAFVYGTMYNKAHPKPAGVKKAMLTFEEKVAMLVHAQKLAFNSFDDNFERQDEEIECPHGKLEEECEICNSEYQD